MPTLAQPEGPTRSSHGSKRSGPANWPPRYLTYVPVEAQRAGDGNDFLRFVEAYGRITKDSIAGPTGEMLPIQGWERQLIRSTFARNPESKRRLHRTALWGMARKNGKTGIVAPLALAGLMLEGDGAEVYSCAADRAQAKLVFAAARRTVELDPELSSRLRLYRDTIEYPERGSIYRALSSEAYTKEGLSPTMTIGDELHAWPNRDLYDVMALAMGARIDPIFLIVTTAGVRTDSTGVDSIALQLYEYGKRVASGELVDPSFFMAWYEAAAGCAVDDTTGWKAANPGLGVILDRDELAGQAHKALAGGMSEAEFRIKRLNQWVTGSTAALPSGSFEALASEREISRAESIVVFFDGSFNHDCTALLGATVEAEPHLFVIACWERPAGDPLWRVPMTEVDATVRDTCRLFNVKELACDPFRWALPMEEWEASDLPVLAYPTSSPARMVPAWASFYDAVLAKTFTHDGDPRLVRHVANMALKVDRLGPRPVKEHRGSPRSIDLGICAIGGYDRATFHATQPSKPTPRFIGYDESDDEALRRLSQRDPWADDF